MNERASITHDLLDKYVSVKGEFEKLTDRDGIDPVIWEIIDQLLLDLHMVRHGYTTDGYAKFVERRLNEVCAGEDVVQRMHGITL